MFQSHLCCWFSRQIYTWTFKGHFHLFRIAFCQPAHWHICHFLNANQYTWTRLLEVGRPNEHDCSYSFIHTCNLQGDVMRSIDAVIAVYGVLSTANLGVIISNRGIQAASVPSSHACPPFSPIEIPEMKRATAGTNKFRRLTLKPKIESCYSIVFRDSIQASARNSIIGYDWRKICICDICK
jgi:hypothetical protein